MNDRPRFIERAFPLKQASLDSVLREKVRHRGFYLSLLSGEAAPKARVRNHRFGAVIITRP